MRFILPYCIKGVIAIRADNKVVTVPCRWKANSGQNGVQKQSMSFSIIFGVVLIIFALSPAPVSAGFFDYIDGIRSLTAMIVWNPSTFKLATTSENAASVSPVASQLSSVNVTATGSNIFKSIRSSDTQFFSSALKQVSLSTGKTGRVLDSGSSKSGESSDSKNKFGMAGIKSPNIRPVAMIPRASLRSGEVKVMGPDSAIKVISVSDHAARIRVYKIKTIKDGGTVDIGNKKYRAVYNPKLKAVEFYPYETSYGQKAGGVSLIAQGSQPLPTDQSAYSSNNQGTSNTKTSGGETESRQEESRQVQPYPEKKSFIQKIISLF